MVARFHPNSLHYSGMREAATGEYVRYEDYAKAIEALRPLADKWLYPDDLGADYAKHVIDDDFNLAESDDTLDDCWIKRAWIRAARLIVAL